MPGAFIPGVLDWSACSGGTVAADGEQISGSAEEIRTPWITASTLALYSHALQSGTFSDVLIRSSLTMPDDRSDAALVQPDVSEFAYYFNPGLGTKPDSQGMSRFAGGGADTVTGGMLNVSTAGGYLYYGTASPGFTAADHTVAIFEFRPLAGHVERQQINIALPHATTGNYILLTLGGSGYAWKIANYLTGAAFDGFTFTPGTTYHLRIDAYASAGVITGAYLSARAAGAQLWDDVTGWTPLGPIARGNSSGQEFYWGCGLGGTTDCDWGHVGIYNGAEWVSVVSGQTSFSAACQRGEVQVKGVLDGVLLSLDLANDLTAPADLSVGADASADGVVRALASAPAAGNVLYWERTGPSTSDTEYHHQRAYAWPDCEDGTHTVSVRQATPSGVLSVNAATDTVTLPISDTYTPPSTPTTPVAYRDPSPAIPSWSTDVSNLILSEPAAPGTGQLAVTTIWIGYQPTPGAAAVKLTTGAGFTSGEVAASSVAKSSVTWASGTGIVTAWAALVTAIRALFPTALICQGNDDGQVVTWSGGIYPTAQGQYEITISGEIDPDRIVGIPGDVYVELRLDEAYTAGNRTYPRQSYRGLIDRTTGRWQVTEVPRGQVCLIKLPYDPWVKLQLPSQATASYGELAPPA